MFIELEVLTRRQKQKQNPDANDANANKDPEQPRGAVEGAVD